MANTTKTRTHLIGGFFGGLTSAVALQPLDLLKTRIQQHQSQSIWSIVKNSKGFSELWRGTLPSAIRTSLGSALYLSSLNLMRTAIAKSKTNYNDGASKSSLLPKLTTYENLISGALARGAVGYMTMPVTVIKVRYESTLYSYTSLSQAVKHIYQSERIPGFFRGFGPTLVRDAPYSGIYVLLYEKAKEVVPKLLPRKFIKFDKHGSYLTSTSTLVNSTSAILSACLATTITAPFDTIKTRMQLEPKRYTNVWFTFKSIIKNEGILKLFSGLSMRLTRKALSAGIAWGIYEELIKLNKF
ncbi:hypothetical protein Kpol_1043p32 [Vanderwaltozyma polyspora DSM 70294]|uniref:Mitochondrial glycine transporter n=1 Tax=Vanderwaltozyma polyspora (strain ATCC 22028 / DSM 70294 / BCRC 21397 / CBS 2163 / NBRC 10782 / NRRL Y-8283 / UCD 57-17) TaxID=436907 RepID=S2538_VANPO|nr:uncharacterized protein Kpol_1043p32 [Vanderwaltozyma polyspora DSM 70294]A7TIQ0.1 RecName: Full=Mitochondrial glycine transporter; AltName: Full=Solute carrier family 25 member 38 homolog [Vanderwaltozyma polyspora DSM 70294]EDO17842.1 hypothetical protein Kpol_1043p32 [Vanderwaltozyma polyspora DSM 70294]